MCCLSQQLAHCSLFFSRRDDVILMETVFELVTILAVEQADPAILLREVLQDTIILLRQDPETLLCIAPTEGQF